MVIIYKNDFNETINEIQAQQMGSFKKEFYVDNVIKKIEKKYLSGALVVTYYKNSNENNVLIALSSEYPDVKDFQIRTKLNIGNYYKEEEEYFEEGILLYKIISIRDSLNRVIASNNLDIVTNLPRHQASGKAFYSEEIYNNWCVPNLELGSILDKDHRVFTAEYNLDGTLKVIEFNFLSTYDTEYFFPNQTAPYDIETCRKKCGLTVEQMNYFLNDTLLPIPNF
jgi:hypothetical protein